MSLGHPYSPDSHRGGSKKLESRPWAPVGGSGWRRMSLCSDELQRRTTIKTQEKSDGLQLLRAIDATQAHDQEGPRVDPTRAAHEAGLDVGDAGSDRYHLALHHLIGDGALVGDEHTPFDVGEEHPHGYALYFFTRRAAKLLEG